MTLLSAFKILLFRYTNQEDILVGTPIANRNQPEIEDLIGFFVNTLVIRSNLSGNPTFRELLKNVKEVCLAAYANQDLPFEKLVEELQPQRNISNSPLFQILFVLQNAPRHALELTNLTMTPEKIGGDESSKFDLTLFLVEKKKRLIATIEYNRDLFESATIQRMAEHFEILLKGIVSSPDRSLSALPILSPTEEQQILIDWNDTTTDYPETMCVHQLFEEQAEKTPDTVAVIFDGQQMTYHELNTKANQLAHYLKRNNIGSDIIVGICVERSLEMIIGMLGILKAGGAYLPLDTEYPKNRLSFILNDSAAPLLLTQKKLKPGFKDIKTCDIFCLDSDWAILEKEPEDNLLSDVTPDNFVYVIYTSGSTGKPKGVAMPHLPMLNLILWHIRQMVFTNSAKTIQFSSFSFDASFHEIFTTFSSGGTLVMISEVLRKDPLSLLHFINENNIERMFLPYVALQNLCKESEASNLLPISLRDIITAGEQLQITSSMRKLFAAIKCRLHNHYGPTESHVVTTYTLSSAVNDWPVFPPIGLPIANTQIFLLDQFLNPVPIGVPGELYIGGDCLADGYINRPELTRTRFIPNHLTNDTESRLYRTGDLARYLPDGNIEFLGRLDHQVKIRGFRVEPGEIETVLNQHPSIREAVTVVREESLTDKRLVSYIVPRSKENATHSELLNFLKGTLPDYMLPSSFMVLDKLPLTPSGKIDRKSLPEPDHVRPELEQVFVAPSTPYEKKIADIWKALLGFEQIGIHDNFFDLGGHSLLATQVISRIRKIFQSEIPLRSIFENPTIDGLINQIELISGIIKDMSTLSGDRIEEREEIDI